jgi:hypothetical protein
MPSTNLSIVLGALVNLTSADLERVKLRVGALNSISGGAKELVVPNPSDFLLDSIYYELRRRGVLHSRSALPPKLITATYIEDSAEVRRLLISAVGPLRAIEMGALGHIAIRALASYLEKAGAPIVPSTLINNISKVIPALEASFPGYLEAGLLIYCLRKERG